MAFKAPCELWNPLSKTVLSKCSSIWNKRPVNFGNYRKAQRQLICQTCRYFTTFWHCHKNFFENMCDLQCSIVPGHGLVPLCVRTFTGPVMRLCRPLFVCIKCGVVITRTIFSTIPTQDTHSSPVRARYGDMGCLLWVQPLIYVLPQFLHLYMQYYNI